MADLSMAFSASYKVMFFAGQKSDEGRRADEPAIF